MHCALEDGSLDHWTTLFFFFLDHTFKAHHASLPGGQIQDGLQPLQGHGLLRC